jgi:hypothetical protein
MAEGENNVEEQSVLSSAQGLGKDGQDLAETKPRAVTPRVVRGVVTSGGPGRKSKACKSVDEVFLHSSMASVD